MTDVYKQGIEAEALKNLETALAEFIHKHPPGHKGLESQIEIAEGRIRLATETASDHGTILVAGAQALIAHLRSSRGNLMPFRKPYPKE